MSKADAARSTGRRDTSNPSPEPATVALTTEAPRAPSRSEIDIELDLLTYELKGIVGGLVTQGRFLQETGLDDTAEWGPAGSGVYQTALHAHQLVIKMRELLGLEGRE